LLATVDLKYHCLSHKTSSQRERSFNTEISVGASIEALVYAHSAQYTGMLKQNSKSIKVQLYNYQSAENPVSFRHFYHVCNRCVQHSNQFFSRHNRPSFPIYNYYRIVKSIDRSIDRISDDPGRAWLQELSLQLQYTIEQDEDPRFWEHCSRRPLLVVVAVVVVEDVL